MVRGGKDFLLGQCTFNFVALNHLPLRKHCEEGMVSEAQRHKPAIKADGM
jgi:hypothetical protein